MIKGEKTMTNTTKLNLNELNNVNGGTVTAAFGYLFCLHCKYRVPLEEGSTLLALMTEEEKATYDELLYN